MRAKNPGRAKIFNRFRNRILRWELGIQPRHAIDRIERRFTFLKKKVLPKVIIAYFKLLTNSWHTGSRFRFLHGTKTTVCPFCKNGPDAIEHMPKCDIVRQLFQRFGCSCSCLIQFFALDQFSFPHKFVTKVKLLSVLFSVHNSINSTTTPMHVNHLINAAVSVILQ